MATETEKLYNESAGTATSPAAAAPTPAAETTPAPTPAPATPSAPVSTGNATLDNYNTGRVNQINQMYDSQRDSALNRLETAHNRTMSDAQAAYDKITPQYQESRNAVGAEYERQRRNNNIQAAANGLNTGAGSQMQLAASSVYQQNQAGLEKAEKDALAEANRQQLTMKEQYDADVADAISKNDAQRAAALLNEYGQQYERMQSEAKQLAAYGDFSLYAKLYGQNAANGMQRAWDLQNPLIAYNLGRLTADEYFSMTGKYPPGYGAAAGTSSGGGNGYGGSGGNPPGGGGTGTGRATVGNVKAAMDAGYGLDDIKASVSNPETAEFIYKGYTGDLGLSKGGSLANKVSSAASAVSNFVNQAKSTPASQPAQPAQTTSWINNLINLPGNAKTGIW